MNKHILFSLLLGCCALLMHSILPDSLKEALREQREELIEIRIDFTSLLIESLQEEEAKINALEQELKQTRIDFGSLLVKRLIKAKRYHTEAFTAFENSCQDAQYEINNPEVQQALTAVELLPKNARQVSRNICSSYYAYKAYLKEKQLEAEERLKKEQPK